MFFCLVETERCAVPHMELLPVDTLDEARDLARRMLAEHLLPVAAHIYMDGAELEIVAPH